MDLKQRLREVLYRFRNEVDYLEIRIENTRETKIDVKKSAVDSINTNFLSGGNVRALLRGGWGFVVFKTLDELEQAAEKAIAIAKLVGSNASHWAKVDPVEYVGRLSFELDPRTVSLEEKVQLMKHYSALIDSYDPKIVTSQVRYHERFMNVILANSEGSYLDQELGDVYLSASAKAVKDGDVQDGGLTVGNAHDFHAFLNLEERIKEKCQLALDLLEAPRIKGGKYTVILNPKLTGVFVHEAFGHTMEADFIADNPAMAETLKIGKPFGSNCLSIYDSGIIPNLRGSYAYDDEGTPAEKTYLLKDGILVGHLHSRETAAKMGEAPTGSARAFSFQHPPIPRMRNTVIEAGSSTFAEMIKDIELGVYAIDANGGKGGENFSFTAHHGYMIRDGKVAELIKGFTLAGNLFKTLLDIDMVGQDEEVLNSGGGCGKGEQFPLPVTNGGPHIRIQNVTIGGEE